MNNNSLYITESYHHEKNVWEKSFEHDIHQYDNAYFVHNNVAKGELYRGVGE